MMRMSSTYYSTTDFYYMMVRKQFHRKKDGYTDMKMKKEGNN